MEIIFWYPSALNRLLYKNCLYTCHWAPHFRGIYSWDRSVLNYSWLFDLFICFILAFFVTYSMIIFFQSIPIHFHVKSIWGPCLQNFYQFIFACIYYPRVQCIFFGYFYDNEPCISVEFMAIWTERLFYKY